MKARLYKPKTDSRASVALSIIVHIGLIAAIGSITFHYQFELFRPERVAPTERIQYVRVQRGAPAAVGESSGGGGTPKQKSRKAAPPPVLRAPSVIPSTLPPVAPPTARGGVTGGSDTGATGAATGVATGVAPALPDSRIELRPNALRLPLSVAQRNDSAVKAIYMAYREAEVLAEEHKGRDPRDWTFERNGQKYGVDTSWIYLGKFKIPSAILAALPFNYGGVDGSRIIQARNAAWIQNDIYTHSQGLSEDDFRAAVRRIRERKDRERKEQEEKEKASQKATPVIP